MVESNEGSEIAYKEIIAKCDYVERNKGSGKIDTILLQRNG
jgi:hypothetical protein